jgi:hypothetical protein
MTFVPDILQNLIEQVHNRGAPGSSIGIINRGPSVITDFKVASLPAPVNKDYLFVLSNPAEINNGWRTLQGAKW